ncbi:MAG: TetR/AcrR family transcriptional regulator [Gammaproteobacteria bacterium]|nr:TetR/AcrR family transcriptional regulator [Gammaproteobacteria bacterium]
MPYTAKHKQNTRARIVECARQLFNRRGFVEVSIDEIMAEAGLTRGGFYNHFNNKEDLFVEAIDLYAHCNPADRWDDVALDFSASGRELARQMVNAYLSVAHLEDIAGHCPLIALPSDVARATPRVKDSYRKLLEGMAGIFQAGVNSGNGEEPRDRGLALAALCVGGMVLARTFDDPAFGNEIREAVRLTALEFIEKPSLRSRP